MPQVKCITGKTISVIYRKGTYTHFFCCSAILLPSDYQYLTLGDLLWIVIITDYVLKLVTVLFKGIYAAIPCVFVHHKQRVSKEQQSLSFTLIIFHDRENI